MEFPRCSKDASKPAVSWLNFEPRVSKFPVIGTAVPFQSLLLLGNSFFVCHHKMGDVLKLEMEFPRCSKDASKPAVSWLNFEPKVSKFPVIGTANAVSITAATGKFLFCCHHKMVAYRR